jgi:hypothetical protein
MSFENIKNKEDITTTPKGQKMWSPPVERIKKLLSEHNLSEIARMEGVSRSAVIYFLERNDLEDFREVRGHRIGGDYFSWKGYEEITGTYWWRIQKSARDRNVEFDLTIEEAWEIYLKQDRKCVLSGLPIYFGLQKGDKKEGLLYRGAQPYTGKYFERQIQTASLDRIISKKKIYNAENCQWVHANVNMLKHKMSDEEVVKWASKVYLYNLEKGKYN